MALVLECGHAVVRRKAQGEKLTYALCDRCQDAEEAETEIRKAVGPMLKRYGTNMVLDVMAKLDRVKAPGGED